MDFESRFKQRAVPEQRILMTARIHQFCSKHGECAIAVRSFSNLIDFEVSFLPNSFMPTCNRNL